MNRGTSLSARRMAQLLHRYWNATRPTRKHRVRWWAVVSWGRFDDTTLQFAEQQCHEVGDWTGARLARLFLMCSITQRTKAEALARRLPRGLVDS